MYIKENVLYWRPHRLHLLWVAIYKLRSTVKLCDVLVSLCHSSEAQELMIMFKNQVQVTAKDCPCETHAHLLEILCLVYLSRSCRRQKKFTVNSLDDGLLYLHIDSIEHYRDFVLWRWQSPFNDQLNWYKLLHWHIQLLWVMSRSVYECSACAVAASESICGGSGRSWGPWGQLGQSSQTRGEQVAILVTRPFSNASTLSELGVNTFTAPMGNIRPMAGLCRSLWWQVTLAEGGTVCLGTQSDQVRSVDRQATSVTRRCSRGTHRQVLWIMLYSEDHHH